MSTDPTPWLHSLRRSHDHLVDRTADLDISQLARPSYCADWTVADVLSHLGSQAEIFGLLVDAGLGGGDAPGPDAFGPIWDTWNARSPEEQAAHSTSANEALVRRLEQLGAEQLGAFRLSAFGMDLDAAGLLRMRLSEHALHTWDVDVVFDPDALVAVDAVELLVDGLPALVARTGTPAAQPATLEVVTTHPDRHFALSTGGVSLEPLSGQSTDGSVRLPAEALVRLVYGRLGTGRGGSVDVDAGGLDLDDLRALFPGF